MRRKILHKYIKFKTSKFIIEPKKPYRSNGDFETEKIVDNCGEQDIDVLFSICQYVTGIHLKEEECGEQIYSSQKTHLRDHSFIYILHQNMNIIGIMDSILSIFIITNNLKTWAQVSNLIKDEILISTADMMLRSYQ